MQRANTWHRTLAEDGVSDMAEDEQTAWALQQSAALAAAMSEEERQLAAALALSAAMAPPPAPEPVVMPAEPEPVIQQPVPIAVAQPLFDNWYQQQQQVVPMGVQQVVPMGVPMVAFAHAAPPVEIVPTAEVIASERAPPVHEQSLASRLANQRLERAAARNAAAECAAQPTTAEAAEILKRELKLNGNMMSVINQAAEQLGVAADLPLVEMAKLCLQKLGTGSAVSSREGLPAPVQAGNEFEAALLRELEIAVQVKGGGAAGRVDRAELLNQAQMMLSMGVKRSRAIERAVDAALLTAQGEVPP